MKRICIHCETEMVENCRVNVENGLYGIIIKKKKKGFLNNISAKPKAAVCPECGYVALYIDEYKEFSE